MKNSLLLLAAILFYSVGYSQKLNVEGDARIQGAFNLKDANNSIRLGDGAGASTTQDSSVLIGELAGAFHAGMNNVFLGVKSGVGTSLFNLNSGNNNTFLGTYTGMSQSLFSTGITNAVALGFRAKVGCSNCASIGGTGDYALKVGIGTETPTTFLDVQGNPDSTNHLINARVNYTGNEDIIAVQGNSRPSAGYGVGLKGIGGLRGVEGIATMFNSELSETTITTAGGHFTNDMRGTGNKYGVYGRVLQSGTTNLRAGVYGEAPNEVNSWAGYFNGKIYAANNVGIGTETPSTLLDVQGNPNSTNDLI
ncbi:MAG: hypothetical protein HRU40_19850, partial [Saprospiraceae bacterium]|nr:hypothetical protein [Saprospiraceae bacterium]